MSAGKAGGEAATTARGALLAASAAAALAAVALAALDAELGGHLARLSALLAALLLWIGEIGPRGPTALLLLVFVDLLGLSATSALFSGFAQPSFLFLMAVLVVSNAIALVGTTTRIGQRMLAGAGRALPLRFVWQVPLLMLGSAALVSSATARVSLIHPVFDDLVEATGARPGLRKYLTLYVANLNPLTSRAFLSGGPGIIVAAELMARAGHELGWAEWALWMGVPVALIFALSTLGHWLWLRPGSLRGATLGHDPFTAADRYLGAVVAGLVGLWIFGPAFGVGATSAALLGMAAVAWLPQGGEVMRTLNWDLVVFAGATLSFADILLDTGTAAWLGRLVFSPLQGIGNQYLATLLVFAVLVLLRLPLSNGVSYSAMVFPIILSLGDVGGLASLHIAFMALVAGGLVFVPIQSNTTLISYASGRYGLRDTVISGVLTFIAAVVVFEWIAVPYWLWLDR